MAALDALHRQLSAAKARIAELEAALEAAQACRGGSTRALAHPMADCLSTTAAVIDRLGGIQAIADLTGRQYTAAHNWKAFGRFPPNTYLTITAALEQAGCTADPVLWKMVEEQSAGR